MGLFSDCKQMVKYSGTNIEIGTVKGPAQVPVSIGGVAIKPQLLQTAGTILQILDWLQFTACQRIHELKKLKDIPSETIADLILRQDDDAHMIADLAIISIAACTSPQNFEKVLADWIASALPRATEASKSKQYLASISGLETVRKEIEKTQDKLESIESETRELEKAIQHLKVQLEETKMRKHQLEDERNKLQFSFKENLMRYPFLNVEISTRERGLEASLSEAISVFPYLSKAISENKSFDIKKSVKALSLANSTNILT